MAFVNDIYFNLTLKFDLPQRQFMAKGFFINGLQESGAEQPMDSMAAPAICTRELR